MISTRQLILNYLLTRTSASAVEVSAAINTTASNIRHHLSILTQEGAVEVVGERPNKKPGRPSQLYAASKRVQQNNLGALSSVLLDEILYNKSPDEKQAIFGRIANRMSGDLPAGKNLTQRLYLAIRRLNEMQYDSRWEAHLNAPYILLGHCPFALILPEHPELCLMDELVIQELLASPVSQVEKLATDNQGATYCKFLVKQR